MIEAIDGAGAESSIAYPEKVVCWHPESDVLSGGAIQTNKNFPTFDDWLAFVPAGLITDAFEQVVILATGTWELRVYGAKAPNNGVIEWSMDGTPIPGSQQDWYINPFTANFLLIVAGIIIAAGGKHTLQGAMIGKNPSSSGYYFQSDRFVLNRTGA